MCTSTTVQRRADKPRTGTAMLRFWRNVKSMKTNTLVLPADLDGLTPHMRRDIGLDSRAAQRWSDLTAHSGRDSGRP